MCLMIPSYESTAIPVLPNVGEDSVTRQLTGRGYENVIALRQHDTLYIGVENRVYSWEVKAVADIIKGIMPFIDSGGTLSLTCLRTGIPVTTLTISKELVEALIDGTITPDAFPDSIHARLSSKAYQKTLTNIRRSNPSFNKFDITIAPLFRAQFGNYSHPLEMQLNIVPAVQISFLKGMSLTAEIIFPLYNDLNPEGNYIRPGLVVLNQMFRMPLNFFATLSAGYFTRNQYGLNGEIKKYLLNGKLSLGAMCGYTADAGIIDGQWVYNTTGKVTWFTDVSYRVARYDLYLSVGFGQFLAGDLGWRADISRQFGEVSIGLFAIQSNGVTNGGFNFVVPLPPRRYGTKNRVRLRPVSEVPWEYYAKGLPAQGKMYSTGYSVESFIYDLHPDYIRTHIGNYIIKN